MERIETKGSWIMLQCVAFREDASVSDLVLIDLMTLRM